MRVLLSARLADLVSSAAVANGRGISDGFGSGYRRARKAATNILGRLSSSRTSVLWAATAAS